MGRPAEKRRRTDLEAVPQGKVSEVMRQLKQLRQGWENEHLATYLLSRASFVARPLTVADDVGTDLYCTLFEELAEGRRQYLVPKSAIAVQVKSNAKPLNVTTKRGYFEGLEVPYYVGVVDRKKVTLDLYSGKYLPHFRSSVDWPRRLRLVPEASRSIVSLLSGEFIFDVPDGAVIFSGRGSARVFRENFYRRLAQAFHSLAWLTTCGEADSAEVDSFIRVYRLLEGSGRAPPHVTEALRVLEEAQSRRLPGSP